MAGRTIAIGDIHGCSAALAALVEAIRPGPEDTLVPLGDYIDRGPDSRRVLDQLIALGSRCRLIPLLGNHEEMLLTALYQRSMLKLWPSSGGVQMLASYGVVPGWEDRPGGLAAIIPPEHWKFLAGCRSFHEAETHIFVHAGYVPDLMMAKQSGDALRWQFTNPRTARPHYSGKTVIVGHTEQQGGEILDLGFLKCIDTACAAGKWLTALDVDNGQVWQANKHGQLRRQPGWPGAP